MLNDRKLKGYARKLKKYGKFFHQWKSIPIEISIKDHFCLDYFEDKKRII